MDFCRKTILLLIFSSFMSVGWGQDTTPPELVYFNFSPDSITLYDRNSIILTYNIFDEFSIKDVWIFLHGPSNQTLNIFVDCYGVGLPDPTNPYCNGTLEYTFDHNTEEGLWFIDMYLEDYFGNTNNLSQSDLIELGFPTEIFITYGGEFFCDEGYTMIDGECYYQSDLDVLQQFIDNSQEGDYNPSSDLSPHTIGQWRNGRLIDFTNWGYGIPDDTPWGYSGDIPESIGELDSLEYLDMIGNQLTGEIPSSIGNLTKLSRLDLSGNQLSGEIPTYIGTLTNLTHLGLYSNELTGSIPSEIGNLSSLTTLSLHYNQLSGEIPSEIGNLSSLEWLNLSFNQLSGEIPSEICDQGDSSPSLSNNQLCLPYPDCLTEDDIGEQNTSECEEPSLCDEEIEVELWGECYSIEGTTVLDLSGNWDNPGELSGEIPPEIGQLWNLTSLNLSHNELIGEIPLEIGNLTNLTSLKLIDNQLTGSIPPEIENLTNLTSLDLSHNQLTGEIPSEIWDLTNLTNLNLGTNQLIGSISPNIGNLENLTGLYLYGNELTGEIPSTIGNLTNLTNLSLFWNELTGEIPLEIGNLINLKKLTLFSNQLVGTIPTEICNLTDLISINLPFNQLSGEIPDCIGNLINLTNLSLYVNNLTGEIPSSVGDLVSLNKLQLNNNLLSGNIPSEIGNLINLFSGGIRLSNNQLTGVIPSEICNNQNLNWSSEWSSDFSVVDDNNLCPPYPDCLINQEPFTDENNNGIWDEGEPYEDTNENGIYEEDYVGYQDTSECIECEGTLGDINEDSVIDILDLVTGINIILETISYTDCQSYLLDFNEDGSTDILDIVEMVNYILPD